MALVWQPQEAAYLQICNLLSEYQKPGANQALVGCAARQKHSAACGGLGNELLSAEEASITQREAKSCSSWHSSCGLSARGFAGYSSQSAYSHRSCEAQHSIRQSAMYQLETSNCSHRSHAEKNLGLLLMPCRFCSSWTKPSMCLTSTTICLSYSQKATISLSR